MKIPLIGAALAVVTACAAPVPAPAYALLPPKEARPEAAPAASADCWIRETKTANGVRLEAVVRADDAVYGTYDFRVTSHGPGGGTDVTQGGEVDLTHGKSATVGSAEFSGGRYRALLTLRDAGGELCSAQQLS
jgi:hypothetical protein